MERPDQSASGGGTEGSQQLAVSRRSTSRNTLDPWQDANNGMFNSFIAVDLKKSDSKRFLPGTCVPL